MQPLAAGQRAQQVQREREDLQRDEQRQQVVGRREDQHAADREQQQREDLGGGEPGLDRGLLAVAAGHGRGLRGERVDAVAVRRRVEPPLGEGEAPRPAPPAGSCPAGTAPVRRRRSRPSPRCCALVVPYPPAASADDRGEGGGQRDDGRRTAGRSSGPCAARTPRPGRRRSPRRGRSAWATAARTRCAAPGSCRPVGAGRRCPQAVDSSCTCAHLRPRLRTVGLVRVGFFCTSDRVCSTAGLTMSVSGFG